MKKNKMLNMIWDNQPGVYIHISFKTIFSMLFFAIVIAVLCVQSIKIQVNPGPAEYPMFIDGKKIVFLGREPVSVAEARDILARFDRHIDDGHRILVPEDAK